MSLFTESHEEKANVRRLTHTGFDGWTALMFAAHGALPGHTKCAEILLKAGARVDLMSRDGKTALMLACILNHPETVSLLLDHSANINLQDKRGFTALMFAAYYGYDEIVTLLLQHDANIFICNIAGWTALQFAAASENAGCVKLLLDSVPTDQADRLREDLCRNCNLEEKNEIMKRLNEEREELVELQLYDPCAELEQLYDPCADLNDRLARMLLPFADENPSEFSRQTSEAALSNGYRLPYFSYEPTSNPSANGVSKWIQGPTCSSARQIRNITSVLQSWSPSHEETHTSTTYDHEFGSSTFSNGAWRGRPPGMVERKEGISKWYLEEDSFARTVVFRDTDEDKIRLKKTKSQHFEGMAAQLYGPLDRTSEFGMPTKFQSGTKAFVL